VRPPDLRGVGDGVHESDQPAGHGDRAKRVEPTPHTKQAALWDDPPSQQQRGYPDRHVEKEDVLPADVAGDKPTGDQSHRGAQGADATPDAECLVALGALAEHVHHDRERRRQHNRGTKPLQPAHRNQESVAVRKPRAQ